jgi:hypothetical protein
MPKFDNKRLSHSLGYSPARQVAQNQYVLRHHYLTQTFLCDQQDNGHIDQILVQSYDLTILPYAVVVHDEACLLYPVGDLEYNA